MFKIRAHENTLNIVSCLPQISTLVPGTSKLRSVPCEQTSSASTAAATTRATATQSLCLWTTVCKVFWDNGSICPRTFKWTTTFGWSGKSSPNLFPGRNCSSENVSRSSCLLERKLNQETPTVLWQVRAWWKHYVPCSTQTEDDKWISLWKVTQVLTFDSLVAAPTKSDELLPFWNLALL